MRTSARSRIVPALAVALTLLPAMPVFLHADTATSTPATISDTSSASGSSSSSTSSTSASGATSTLSTADTTAASSTASDSLSVTASSSDPNLLSGSSSVAEIVSGAASSSQNGFVSGAPRDGGATSTASSTAGTSNIPVSVGSSAGSPTAGDASGTPAIASSTQTIITGNALALANILNLLNASFVNSSGAILFANFPGSVGTIDVRDSGVFNGLCNGSPCSNLQGLLVQLLSSATLHNDVAVVANSGQNQIENASSSPPAGQAGAAIQTGSAFAGLNLVNLANVAFLNSNYLILTLNAFRNVNGDIVFPSLLSFTDSGSGGIGSNSNLASSNQGTVANTVTAAAASGDNTTAVGGQSTIVSGSADSKVNIYNGINSLLAGSGISVLIRIGGAWNGRVQGVPNWVSVATSTNGVYITGVAPGSEDPTTGLGLIASSTAGIDNNAYVAALTGQNGITGSSTALISTGDAFAAANIINIANQTVIGRNWLLAIINIFGDFNGNIDFGRPDVWVGDSVNAPQYVHNGTTLTYVITVKNNGDADAHYVSVDEAYDAAHLTIATSSMPYSVAASGDLIFAIGDLAPGQTMQITYDALAQNAPPGTTITNHTTATEDETDNNPSDNTDSVTVVTNDPPVSGGGGIPAAAVADSADSQSATGTAVLEIVRDPSNVNAMIGTPVAEKIIVRNVSQVVARGVILKDLLKNPDGRVVHEEDFAIGDIDPGSGVAVTYTFNFAADATAGLYRLDTDIAGDNIPETDAVNGSIYLQGVRFVPFSGFTSVMPLRMFIGGHLMRAHRH